jgi:hypothetical protein
VLTSSQKGTWWLPQAHEGQITPLSPHGGRALTAVQTDEEAQLMQLAASQRMNTDSRRAVFCVLMAADDYVRMPPCGLVLLKPRINSCCMTFATGCGKNATILRVIVTAIVYLHHHGTVVAGNKDLLGKVARFKFVPTITGSSGLFVGDQGQHIAV